MAHAQVEPLWRRPGPYHDGAGPDPYHDDADPDLLSDGAGPGIGGLRSDSEKGPEGIARRTQREETAVVIQLQLRVRGVIRTIEQPLQALIPYSYLSVVFIGQV